MLRKIPPALWCALPMAFLLYFYHLQAVGMLPPDEPRYAAIGREMARSGDWVTPRLWGEPFFEKPALLYWMIGAAFRAGLGPDLSPRLPVALLAVAFLAFYWWILNREFGPRAAWYASLILGTSGGWLACSQVGVTDLPLAATFSAAMLLALPWIARRDSAFLPVASALFGFAVLAKSLPALVLAAPLAFRWRWARDFLRLRVFAPFLAVALPWHLVCYFRNGRPFLYTLFVEHQFGRFTSGALLHVQPAWFYLPVLLGLLLPWTPLLVLLARPAAYHDSRRLFLLLWLFFGLLFFSASVNKLPAYILPLLPAAAALMAVALDEAGGARTLLTACALLLVAIPIATQILPAAVANGLSHSPRPSFQPAWLAPLAVALAVWLLEHRSHRLAAMLSLAAGVTAGMFYLKIAAAPELNRTASARELWSEIAAHSGQVCVSDVGRNWRYALNYYSVTPLPDCSAQPRPLHVVRPAGQPARVIPPLSGRLTADRPPL